MFNSAARVLMCLRGMGCVPASQWATCTCSFASGYPSARPTAFCVMPAASLARFKISFAGVDFTPILCYNVASKRVLDGVSPRAVRRQCRNHWRLFYVLHPIQRNAYRDCNRHQQNKNLLQHSGITSLLLNAPGWRRPLADHE